MPAIIIGPKGMADIDLLLEAAADTFLVRAHLAALQGLMRDIQKAS